MQKGPVEAKCSTQKYMDFPKSCSFSKVYSCMSIVKITKTTSSLLSSWNHYFYFAAPPIRWVAKRIISCPNNLVPLPSLEHHLNPEFWTLSVPLWRNNAKITNPNQNKSNLCMDRIGYNSYYRREKNLSYPFIWSIVGVSFLAPVNCPKNPWTLQWRGERTWKTEEYWRSFSGFDMESSMNQWNQWQGVFHEDSSHEKRFSLKNKSFSWGVIRFLMSDPRTPQNRKPNDSTLRSPWVRVMLTGKPAKSLWSSSARPSRRKVGGRPAFFGAWMMA